jgi:hypothetical protein
VGECQILQQSRVFGIHKTLAIPTSLMCHPGHPGGQAGGDFSHGVSGAMPVNRRQGVTTRGLGERQCGLALPDWW